MSYLPVPASADSPAQPTSPWSRVSPSSRTLTLRPLTILKYLLGGCTTIIVLHFVVLGAFPKSTYAETYGSIHRPFVDDRIYVSATDDVHSMLDKLDPAVGQPGTFFRDSFPIRSMLAFWELAEKEAKEKNVDVCNGQLGRELIDAYHDSTMAYCLPRQSRSDVNMTVRADARGDVSPSKVWCSPVHRHPFSRWWPYPAAPCLSTNLRPMAGKEKDFEAVGCDVTPDGVALREEMGREKFLGTYLNRADPRECRTVLNHTVIVIGRQDQWNPFHVAEDLITTLVSVFIAARAAPALINSRVQLVFSEGFGMDQNHFTPLWDRVGAWAPKRLSLDPWDEGVCLTNTIHSVGAGASLLSAMGVGSSFTCASTITWAASHYYRHLFGLLPLPLRSSEDRGAGSRTNRPINVLWLSRSKLDAYTKEHGDWSSWRGMRHINNEDQLLDRFRQGLSDMCGGDGVARCAFEDIRQTPEAWTQQESVSSDDPLPIRFAAIDPTVHALETQIHYVGHATILISSHGGALGLSLFLPPGNAAVIELQVGGVMGNYHFQHMAYEMGHQYEMLEIEQTVDIEQIWEGLRRRVVAFLGQNS